MRTVYKYEFPNQLSDYLELEIPKNYQILTVQVQKEKPCIWVLVNPENEKENVRFRLAGTGQPIKDDIKKYINTFQLFDGYLVFHLFEIY